MRSETSRYSVVTSSARFPPAAAITAPFTAPSYCANIHARLCPVASRLPLPAGNCALLSIMLRAVAKLRLNLTTQAKLRRGPAGDEFGLMALADQPRRLPRLSTDTTTPAALPSPFQNT